MLLFAWVPHLQQAMEVTKKVLSHRQEIEPYLLHHQEQFLLVQTLSRIFIYLYKY